MTAYLPKRWPQRRRWRSFTRSDERSKKTTHLLGRHLEVPSKQFPGHLRPSLLRSRSLSRHATLLPTNVRGEERCVTRKKKRLRRRLPQASYISLVPNVFPAPSHLWEQPGCLSLQRWKQDSEDTRREEFRRSPRVACSPSFSRVRVYFARPITLAEIIGYSQRWTVTLLLDSLADTIAFSFNKFIILCTMCNYVPDWIRKKIFQKLRRKVLLFLCRSTRPRAKENLWTYEYFATVPFLCNRWFNSCCL